MATTVSRLKNRDFWEDDENVKDLLARQLVNGRLALFLGSGVSSHLGLAQWDQLLETAFARKSATRPDKLSNEDAAEYLLHDICNDSREDFNGTLHDALYERIDSAAVSTNLAASPLLAALGNLVMAGRRGNVRHVVTFNFDDLLEQYLIENSYVVQQIVAMPFWSSRADVVVYHPHGLLPIGRREAQGEVVIAQIHFDHIIGNRANAWRSALLEILRSNTCVFLGLSGADQNLTNMLADARDTHAARETDDLYWGVRFSDNVADPRRTKWGSRGVWQVTLGSYEALPAWLKDVARRAAAMIVV